MAAANENRATLVVGLSLPQSSPDAARLLQVAREDGYDYVTTMLPSNTTGESRSDVTDLESRWWRTSVVGCVAPELLQQERSHWESLLQSQADWATHMSIPAILLPLSTDPMYVRAISSIAPASSGSNGQVWIKTRLNETDLNRFSAIHAASDGASNVGILLEMENIALPAVSGAAASTVAGYMTLIHKAIGSQLKAVCFPTSVFLTNKRGYPTLSKTHQVLVTEILRRIGRTVRILVEGPPVHLLESPDAPVGATGCLPYLQYIRHIRQRPEITSVLDTEEATMEEPYLDHLQRPLQPLGDHLEFQTYETFEKDPVKYAQYKKSILLALRDGWTSVQDPSEALTVTILIVGAGRGPLVTAALEAVELCKVLPEFANHTPLQARIWAVEKNPSAVLYLQSMVKTHAEWKPIRVLQMDMRDLAKAKLGKNVVDIVVSELLGSFGDNELSPECLEGVRKTGLLKDTTVCIPQQYTSFLAPVSSMRLHSEARAQAFFPASAADGLDSAPMGHLKAMETPYVVRSHAACQTHVEKPCWEFVHFSSEHQKMQRHVELEFSADPTHGAGCGSGYGPFDSAVATMAQASGNASSGSILVHGFLGTFSSRLYASTAEAPKISTAPTSFSAGMFSWFPLYFPLSTPLLVPSNARLVVNMWRRTDSVKRVWYEWSAQVVDKDDNVLSMTHVHNANGRSYHVDM